MIGILSASKLNNKLPNDRPMTGATNIPIIKAGIASRKPSIMANIPICVVVAPRLFITAISEERVLTIRLAAKAR